MTTKHEKSPAARAHEASIPEKVYAAISEYGKASQSFQVRHAELNDLRAALSALETAVLEALRAERVRVLEEVLRVSHYSHEPGPPELGDLRIVRRMLSSARAEGASEMVDGLSGADSKRVASSLTNRQENLAGRARGTTAPNLAMNVPSPHAGCPGSIPEQPSVIRPPSEEPEPGGGKCKHKLFDESCPSCQRREQEIRAAAQEGEDA